MDAADLDLQYLAGEIAMAIFTQFPTKSGRRRAILSREHGQMHFNDVDMDRLTEFSTGEFYLLQNINFKLLKNSTQNFPTKKILHSSHDSFLARNHTGGPLRVRIHFGSIDDHQSFVEVTNLKFIPFTKIYNIYKEVLDHCLEASRRDGNASGASIMTNVEAYYSKSTSGKRGNSRNCYRVLQTGSYFQDLLIRVKFYDFPGFVNKGYFK